MNACPHCNQYHDNMKCPLVKAIEYYEGGGIKRVEYMTPADYIATPLQPYWPPRPIT
jgi:hypothetical protein